jgi:hypothetical protein
MQSKELTQFYRDYAKWLDDGAPQYQPFSRHRGLCSNSVRYEAEMDKLYFEMKAQFIAANLPDTFPFDEGNGLKYFDTVDQATCYLNRARIQWVKDHC